MKPMTRAIWLLALVAFTAGCSTMRPAAWPGGDGTPPAGDRTLPEVAAGDRVTVELLDGSTLQGVVLRITEDFLTVDVSRPAAGFGDEAFAAGGADPRTAPRSSVLALRKDVPDGTGTALLVVGVAGVVGGIIALSMMEPMGGGSLFQAKAARR